MRRPRSRAAKSSGPAACRRTVRGPRTSTSAMVRPTAHRSKPRRTVSTSGSSGMVRRPRSGADERELVGVRDERRERRPRLLRGALLGLLLAATVALSGGLTGNDRSGVEGLGVVGAALAHEVLRHAERTTGGQFLQRGLPVQSGAELSGGIQQWLEQLVEHRPRRLQPARDVYGTEQSLERVGQDRRLVPAAAGLLAAAEAQVAPHAE